MPAPPSKPHCANPLPTAPLLAVEDGAVEDVGEVEAVVPELEVGEVDDEDVELTLTLSMKTPPAMAGGELVLADLAPFT